MGGLENEWPRGCNEEVKGIADNKPSSEDERISMTETRLFIITV